MIEKGELGLVKISKTVIADIASRAAIEIEGVAGVGGGAMYYIYKYLRFKHSYGISVEIIGEHDVEISIPIIVKYGKEISSVASEVQDNVKKVVEEMTGLDVIKVDVKFEGVE